MSFPLSSGLLDAVVLSVLEQEDAYGYRITNLVRSRLDISESTLYPVLRRLEKNDFLTVYDRAIDGRNRRYYAITPAGRKQLADYRRDWHVYRTGIESLLFPGGKP
ncbi:PadR family transcriptional regulator [Butyricicoccus sp.]|uniref:PadR family transcriptional regulator n=1 Tax=Butyricicoccus sp. TaxID=2049021 RepID=UPI003F16BAF5